MHACIYSLYTTELQQEQVLTELFHHSSQVPPPEDAQSVGITRLYLEGCNQLFERGLVCHTKIRDNGSEVLKSIDKGYQFFLKWNEYLVKKCKYYC